MCSPCVCLFILYALISVIFLLLLVSGVGCGLLLWHSIDIHIFHIIKAYAFLCRCLSDWTLSSGYKCALQHKMIASIYQKHRKGHYDYFVLIQLVHLNAPITALANMKWTASSEFGTYSLCEQRRFRRACACAQSRQNLRCSLIQAVNQEEPSDRKPDPWPF